jgi:hypothetical protein
MKNFVQIISLSFCYAKYSVTRTIQKFGIFMNVYAGGLKFIVSYLTHIIFYDYATYNMKYYGWTDVSLVSALMCKVWLRYLISELE